LRNNEVSCSSAKIVNAHEICARRRSGTPKDVLWTSSHLIVDIQEASVHRALYPVDGVSKRIGDIDVAISWELPSDGEE